ncbi:MAG: RNA methyltransferase [Alphaproteobacteria bacterium]|nr:RNA methyltransferase [Alphaproteobacteria bacterium]
MSIRRLAALVLLAALLPLAACGEAARVLADIEAAGGPSALSTETPPPTRQALALARAGRSLVADLYLPSEPPAAALVLAPGLSPDGKDDARLVALARSLARARFVVLVPDLPQTRALRADAAEARLIADAALALAAHPANPRPGRVALAGISFAVGLVKMAALEPDAAPVISMVTGLGGYHSATAMVTFLTTGRFRAGKDAPWQEGVVDPYGLWAFVRGNAGRLTDRSDAILLAAIAERRMRAPDAPVAPLLARLGPQGRAVWALVENQDPAAVPALIAALPAPVASAIAALDLTGRPLGAVAHCSILVHGEDDGVIPPTESVALAARLPRARTRLFLVPGFSHVDPRGVPIAGRLVLLDAMRAILSWRDSGTCEG